MALLFVLAMLTLLSILVVGLLISARQEVATSKSYSDSSDVRMLAELSGNLVISQIAQATTAPDVAWISQPGLIRTFDPTGQLAAYKLYSSDHMVVNDPAYDPIKQLSTEVPAGWDNKPDEFVDLNRPVVINYQATSGQLNRTVYPIVDPGAASSSGSPPHTGALGDGSQASFTGAEGFSYDASGVAPTNPASANELPMPVRWLYVTPDGQIFDGDANPALRPKATARVAFWADDETCKINLNTAAGGVFFDTPCAETIEEQMLGRTQPVAQEYQRWPGHPATTSILPLYPQLRALAINGKGPAAISEAVAAFNPRVAGPTPWSPSTYGSDGGTTYAWSLADTNQAAIWGGPVALKSQRLFASIDETIFGVPLSGTAPNQTRTLNSVLFPTSTTTNVEQKQIDQLRFFTTVHSKAPETNIFNRPRVSLWPFNADLVTTQTGDPRLTPEDKLIRFASELGGADPNNPGSLLYPERKRFYFQRYSAWNPQADWSGKTDGILENQNLFSYLEDMTSRDIPGPGTRAGTSFAEKYGTQGRDQILTEMWDYIRSNVNTSNFAYLPVDPAAGYSFPESSNPTTKPFLGTQDSGYNDIAPLLVNPPSGKTTKGIGRYPVPVEFAFQFVNCGDYLEKKTFNAPPAVPANYIDNNGDGIPDYVVRRIRLVMLIKFHMPMNSLLGSQPRLQVKVTGPQFFNYTLPGTYSPLSMRVCGTSTWSPTLPMTGMEFPVPDDGGGYIATNYISGFNYCVNLPIKGGQIPLNWSMVVPQNDLISDNNTGQPYDAHLAKILSNKTTLQTYNNTEILKDRDGTPVKSDQDAYTWYTDSTRPFYIHNASSRPDVYYPFVSDIIEFRLPNAPVAKNGTDTLPLINPANTKSEDFFNVNFVGGPLTITIYPGLTDTARNLDSTSWQPQTASNYLFQTTVNVASATIPLPRPIVTQRSPDITWNVSAPVFGQGNTTIYDTDSRDYSQRLSAQDESFLLGIPRRHQTPGPSYQTDVIRSYVLSGGAPVYGDIRQVAAVRDVPGSGTNSWYVPHVDYQNSSAFLATALFPDDYVDFGNVYAPHSNEINGLATVAGTTRAYTYYDANSHLGELLKNTPMYAGAADCTRAASSFMNGALRNAGATPGDFALGFGDTCPGGLIVGPDLGAGDWWIFNASSPTASASVNASSPYYGTGAIRQGDGGTASNSIATSIGQRNLTGVLFSPFKQMPSAVPMGTLPARPDQAASGPWETLLFCPNPPGGQANHHGWTAPRDHFLLDLFYMPVVEPYAITENLATAGKINLNYQIAPFTYITRKTALYGLLDEMTQRWGPTQAPNFPAGYSPPTTLGTPFHGSALVSIPSSDAAASSFRMENVTLQAASGFRNTSYRGYVDAKTTLDAFDTDRFNKNDPFISPSEICEMYMLNSNFKTSSAANAFWTDPTQTGLTGIDKREMPYNHLLPRVTTKSNTFRVHFWVQTLNANKNPVTPIVTAEYRGSMIVERYLDPNIAQYGNGPTDFPSLNSYYKYRELEIRQFSP